MRFFLPYTCCTARLRYAVLRFILFALLVSSSNLMLSVSPVAGHIPGPRYPLPIPSSMLAVKPWKAYLGLRSIKDTHRNTLNSPERFSRGLLSHMTAAKEDYGGASPDGSHALLVIVPGGLLGPKDYEGLEKAVKNQSQGMDGTPSMEVYTGVASIDWMAMQAAGPGAFANTSKMVEVAIKKVMEEAEGRGFKPMGNTSGRVDNLFVVMHSFGASWATAFPMRYAGGAIMLAAGMVPQEGVWPSVHEYPRPLMHILGQLDGQYRTTFKGATIAGEAVATAVQLGPRYMARTRPFCIIPGMNHAQFSNGVVNVARGDLTSDLPQEPLLNSVAGLMLRFVEANHPSSSKDLAASATDNLLHATQQALEMVSPFTEALGRGSLMSYFESNVEEQGALISAAAPLLYGFGAEAAPATYYNKHFVAHPGELAAAEKLAVQVQRRMLEKGLPQSVVDSVQVIARVHTALDMFITSQPTVFQIDSAAGTRTVVHAHIYLHRQNLESDPAAYFKPMSPQYFIKLKKAEVVAHAMGLVIEDVVERTVSAAELHRELYQQALQSAHPLVLDTFKARGRTPEFGEDRDITAEIASPVDWMHREPTLDHIPQLAPNTTITSPCVSTACKELPHYDRGPGRFVGNHYIKVMSLAWMHEWLMVEGLRPPPPPPTA